ACEPAGRRPWRDGLAKSLSTRIERASATRRYKVTPGGCRATNADGWATDARPLNRNVRPGTPASHDETALHLFRLDSERFSVTEDKGFPLFAKISTRHVACSLGGRWRRRRCPPSPTDGCQHLNLPNGAWLSP